MRMMRSILDRRRFLKTAGVITAGVVCLHRETNGQEADKQPVTIKNLRIAQGVSIEADNGTEGSFKGSGSQDLKTLQEHLAKIRELLVGRNPFDPMLEGELFWERIYPGKARLLAQGRDPLTGETIANKPRKERHTKTGRIFMAFSTVYIALWDLRGKLLKQPSYRIIGEANRKQVPVYWRPGEANKVLDDARQRAREAYDKGYCHQKWYFTKSAKDGAIGLKENIELVHPAGRATGRDAYVRQSQHPILRRRGLLGGAMQGRSPTSPFGSRNLSAPSTWMATLGSRGRLG